ncbi:HAD-IA family hydrolase [Flavobacteriaceae bacterium Ap0902]|nr:HAD-IA family hydrolase [Flavobacteriaceae bacterium Ap0902]
MELKAVLFDMDGVIVDTEPLHYSAYYGMFEKVGIEVSPDFYRSFTGQSTKNVCNELKESFHLDIEVEEMIKIKRKLFKDSFDNDPNFDLLSGVKDLIQFYYENGVKLVLASSASMNTINWVFERFDLNPYFIDKISGADLQESKPNPEIFIKAAQMAGEERENCLVIEDSTNGIQAAHAARIYCIAYKSPHSINQDYSLADKIITDFKEAQILSF